MDPILDTASHRTGREVDGMWPNWGQNNEVSLLFQEEVWVQSIWQSSIGRFLLSSRSNWASWQMISHKHNWKQLVGSVDRGILFNMHSSYLLCSGSAVRTVKLQAQFQLHFYDLRGFTLNLAQPWTKFSNNETNNRIIIRTSRFIIIT